MARRCFSPPLNRTPNRERERGQREKRKGKKQQKRREGSQTGIKKEKRSNEMR
jgi:hypothetical protein